MKLKGTYNGETTYSVGDVVLYEDGVSYLLNKPCKAGTPPVKTLYWERLQQPFQEVVGLIMDGLSALGSEIESKIPTNISDDAITLKGTDDAEYLITVDDSGDTPDLTVTLIEEEE